MTQLLIELFSSEAQIWAQIVKISTWINEALAEGRGDIMLEQVAEIRADRQALKIKLDQEIARLLAKETEK